MSMSGIPSRLLGFALRKRSTWKQDGEEEGFAEKGIDILVKKVKGKKDLEKLEKALRNPEEETKCVVLTRPQDKRLQVLHKKHQPHYLACRIWRWPDLQKHQELEALPVCQCPYSSTKSKEVCINPYHYRRVQTQATFPAVLVSRSVQNPVHVPMNPVNSTNLAYNQYDGPCQPDPSLRSRQQQQQQHFTNQNMAGYAMMNNQNYIQGYCHDANSPPMSSYQMQCSPPNSLLGGNENTNAQQLSPLQQQQQQHHQNMAGYAMMNKQNYPQNYSQNANSPPMSSYQMHSSSPNSLVASDENMNTQLSPFQQQQQQQHHQNMAGYAMMNKQNYPQNYSHNANSPPMSSYQMHSSSPNSLVASDENMNTQLSPLQQQQQQQQDFTNQNLASYAMMNRQEYPLGHCQGFPEVEYCEAEKWCSIIYYELNNRVGDLFEASMTNVVVDGFTDPSTTKSRFCLGSLSNVYRNPTIENTRKQIGKGLALRYVENGDVTVECLSNKCIFVESCLYNSMKDLPLNTVYKVTKRSSLVIFDLKYFATQLSQAATKEYKDVFEMTKMCSVYISFVKGWGQEYRRMDRTSTPCWIEVKLNGPLRWIDMLLNQMISPDNPITSTS